MPTLPAHLSAAHTAGLPATATLPAPRTATTGTGGLVATGPVFAGTGWRITTQCRTYCLSPSQQYTVTFPTQALKDRYVPYLTTAVGQLVGVGVNIAIGGIETPDYSTVPPQGHIQYGEAYRPVGTAGYSQGLPCYNTADNSVWGGYVLIDSEYWDGTWTITDTVRKNTLVHELCHALGLDHCNSDMNNDGKVTSYETVKDTTGVTPLMTSPNGGYQDSRAGTLTPYDLNGIKQLLANAAALGVA
ncbi:MULTISPECIES: hypothetical protein [unclassified Streptomyces]|uniref:hypothetical protein n=1 Tax=unclassified Streptomyces TaxID=2593676 RepID=UPI000885431A|nr:MULTISPECIES: hypothetical protein [unclassified Streptomyces]PBC72290.1 hypothetical protein BX261_7374 [Streptomyces sp. 2321.6]SDR62293.1 hypothetical protein SAMN05216511_7329 [Streptomyces sp. KS_16]SEE51638.1 hypothetical protein SAMN05428940_7378 [Streptomyces sp. 2133.1]SNC77794.1 hypothetical protein SAMN06272741_7210 [Streptomyces sp. 2114.4]